MDPGHPKALSQKTLELFDTLVPSATRKGPVASLKVDGRPGHVRIKRADVIANQIHVWRGEPIALHMPSDGRDVWYVLPVSWQLSYARLHARAARQHASTAYECMMVSVNDMPSKYAVPSGKNSLREAGEAGIREARSREIRFIVKALSRTRDAVAEALITTFEEEFPAR